MNIGKNFISLKETWFQDLPLSKANVTGFTVYFVELYPLLSREITLLIVNLNGKSL